MFFKKEIEVIFFGIKIICSIFILLTVLTLCIYMGVRRLADISETLQDGGLAGTTPVAIVADATLEEQTVHVTTLAEAPIFSESLLSRPSLIIVGEVVRWAELHDTMISMQAAGV